MIYSGVLGDLRFIGLKDQTNNTSPQVMDEIVAALPNDTTACESGLATPETDFTSFFTSFPAGDYPFFASSITLEREGITAPLTHVIPAAPNVVFPAPGATLPDKGFAVRWKKVRKLVPTFPDAFAGAGITDADVSITGYKVRLDRVAMNGTPGRKTLMTAEVEKRRMRIPNLLVDSGGDYEVTVWQVEASGNMTSVTVPFSVR